MEFIYFIYLFIQVFVVSLFFILPVVLFQPRYRGTKSLGVQGGLNMTGTICV